MEGLFGEAEALCPPNRVKEKLVPLMAAIPAGSLGIGFPIPVTRTLKIKTYPSENLKGFYFFMIQRSLIKMDIKNILIVRTEYGIATESQTRDRNS